MFTTIGAAILGFCVQSIGRKSIFNLSGVAQAIAGKKLFFFFEFLCRIKRKCVDGSIFYVTIGTLNKCTAPSEKKSATKKIKGKDSIIEIFI